MSDDYCPAEEIFTSFSIFGPITTSSTALRNNTFSSLCDICIFLHLRACTHTSIHKHTDAKAHRIKNIHFHANTYIHTCRHTYAYTHNKHAPRIPSRSRHVHVTPRHATTPHTRSPRSTGRALRGCWPLSPTGLSFCGMGSSSPLYADTRRNRQLVVGRSAENLSLKMPRSWCANRSRTLNLPWIGRSDALNDSVWKIEGKI